MAFEAVLRAHLVRYPSMQIQDVYKLIHQACLGSEHAISNPEATRVWMGRELAEMGAGPIEPVIDPISGDGEIARVHLRPFIAQGGNPEALLEAFVRTANEYRGEQESLETVWKIAASLGVYPNAEMKEFIQSMRAQNFPATHHSPEYERLYRPAYRVILTKLLS